MTDQVSSLRYVTDTLSVAKREQLPRLIPTLTTHLANCSEILCSKAQNSQTAASASSLVHQLRTQISSLLQDKSWQGRWSAVVLVKITTESVVQHQEGWEFLRASAAWVRGLLAILGKPDPLPTKTMVILLLTRIFLLTHGQASLTREITTPHLASFVTACLNLVTTKSVPSGVKVLDPSCGYLEIVLQCFIRLLPNHPAIFRTFSGQIRSFISPLIAATPSDLTNATDAEKLPLSEKVSTLARYVHALLPLCALKNGASEEWSKNVLMIINQINRTTDQAFRAVQNNRAQRDGALKDLEEALQEPVDQIEDGLMLPRWHGVVAGCERIQGLLSLLSAYLATKGNMNYPIPIKAIHKMAIDLLSVTQPQITISEGNSEEVNRSISREERGRLYMMLPQIHTAVFEVLSKTISRMSAISFSILMDLVDQIMWTMQRSPFDTRLRSTVYTLMNQIIKMVGASISPSKSASINFIVQMACRDLITADERPNVSVPGAKENGMKPQYNADSFLSTAPLAPRTSRINQICRSNALSLLCTAMLHVQNSSFIPAVRSEIDKVGVLLQHEELQLSSVLNPNLDPRYENTNPVPFLAKLKSPLVEALIHRRCGAVISREEAQENDGYHSEMIEMDAGPISPDLSANMSGTDVLRNKEIQTTTETMPQHGDTLIPSTRRNDGNSNLDLAVSDIIETERAAKRPRLQDDATNLVQAHETPDNTSTTELDAVLPRSAEADIVVDIKSVIRNSSPDDSASDGSFEIPEIFVDSEDNESEPDDQD